LIGSCTPEGSSGGERAGRSRHKQEQGLLPFHDSNQPVDTPLLLACELPGNHDPMSGEVRQLLDEGQDPVRCVASDRSTRSWATKTISSSPGVFFYSSGNGRAWSSGRRPPSTWRGTTRREIWIQQGCRIPHRQNAVATDSGDVPGGGEEVWRSLTDVVGVDLTGTIARWEGSAGGDLYGG